MVIKQIVFLVLAVSVFVQTVVAQDETERSSLKIEGCSVIGVAVEDNNGIAFAGCDGTNGLYYSKDFGSSWILASGGAYTSGAASALVTGKGHAAAIVNNQLLITEVTGDSSWQPAWSLNNTIQNPQSLSSNGDYIFVCDNQKIDVYDVTSGTFTQSVNLPENSENNCRFVVGADHGYLLINQAGSANRRYYRASFDSSNGSIAKTLNWDELTNATGLPAGENRTFWNIFAEAKNDHTFVAIREQGESTVDKLWVSSNDGASFSEAGLSSVPNSACFSGDNYLIGNALSINAGQSWQVLTRPKQDQGFGGFEDTACAFDPSSSERVLKSTNQGFDRSTDFITNSGSASWQPAINGMEAIKVYSISQSATSDSKVVVGTGAGVTVSSNFNAAEPDWTIFCPGGDCVGGQNVVIDPVNDNIFYYGSGNIRKCTVDYSGESPVVACVDFADKHTGDFINFAAFDVFNELPGKLVSAYHRTEGSTDGGLYLYNLSDGAASSFGDLNGLPLGAFIPLSSDVMFASAGQAHAAGTEAYRGIYVTRNGGTSWTEMDDADLDSLVLVRDFAYDTTNDILYAATATDEFTTTGTVYYLPQALNGGTDWQKPATGPTDDGGQPANKNFSAIEVEPVSGAVYASADSEIWRSQDGGSTWERYYKGAEGETTQELEVEEAVESTALAGSFKLYQASSSGLYAFSGESNVSDLKCTLSLKGCSRRARRGQRCKLIAKLVNSETGTAIENASVQYYRRRNKRKEWGSYGKMLQSNAKGKRRKAFKARKTFQYQAVFQAPYACTTKIKRVKVK